MSTVTAPIGLSLFTRVCHQHESIAQMRMRFSAEQFSDHPVPGKWSALEQIAHLNVYQLLFLARVDRILEEKNPTIIDYIPDSDPDFIAACTRSVDELIAQLDTDRHVIIRKVAGWSIEELKRVGVHSMFGELSLQEWTQFFVLHEGHHLFSVFKLLLAGK